MIHDTIYENKTIRKSDSYWLNLYKVNESKVIVDRLNFNSMQTLDQNNIGNVNKKNCFIVKII